MDNDKAIAALYRYYNDPVKLYVEFDGRNNDGFRFSVDVTVGEGGKVLVASNGASLEEAVSNVMDKMKVMLLQEHAQRELAHKADIQRIQDTLDDLGNDKRSD